MKHKFQDKSAAFHLGMQALISSFGGVANMGFAIIVVVTFISIGWFGDQLFAMIPTPYKMFMLLPLLILLLIFSSFKRLFLKPVAPSITQHGIRDCKAIIWFLSPPGFCRHKNKHFTGEEKLPDDMGSWRMAYEAISRHMKQTELHACLVIPSSDTCGRSDGSYHDLSRFMTSMSTATGLGQARFMAIPQYKSGVDFEDADELYQAVEAAYKQLEEMEIKEQDVVLDITGGQKLPGIIGGIAGLGDGRRFQYVSTRNYHIQEYHITYKLVS